MVVGRILNQLLIQFIYILDKALFPFGYFYIFLIIRCFFFKLRKEKYIYTCFEMFLQLYVLKGLRWKKFTSILPEELIMLCCKFFIRWLKDLLIMYSLMYYLYIVIELILGRNFTSFYRELGKTELFLYFCFGFI